MTAGHYMATEMAEQPEVIAGLLRSWDTDAAAVAALLPSRLEGVTFVARGSSNNAARLGSFVTELYAGIPATTATPSLVTRYDSRPHTNRLIVAISQSGRTAEIVAAAERLRGPGSVLLAITNDASSPLALLGDLYLPVGAGVEVAVPATKSLTAQVVRVLLVAAVAAERMAGAQPWTAAERQAGLAALVAVLADSAPVAAVASVVAAHDRLQVVGRGMLQAIIDESALKIRESAGVFAQGISAYDLVHGPIAALTPDVPVWVVDGGGPTSLELAELIERLRQVGSTVLTSSMDATSSLPLVAGITEAWTALPVLARAQQLALGTAVARGLDPDAPAGLSKVTLTAP